MSLCKESAVVVTRLAVRNILECLPEQPCSGIFWSYSSKLISTGPYPARCGEPPRSTVPRESLSCFLKNSFYNFHPLNMAVSLLERYKCDSYTTKALPRCSLVSFFIYYCMASLFGPQQSAVKSTQPRVSPGWSKELILVKAPTQPFTKVLIYVVKVARVPRSRNEHSLRAV